MSAGHRPPPVPPNRPDHRALYDKHAAPHASPYHPQEAGFRHHEDPYAYDPRYAPPVMRDTRGPLTHTPAPPPPARQYYDDRGYGYQYMPGPSSAPVPPHHPDPRDRRSFGEPTSWSAQYDAGLYAARHGESEISPVNRQGDPVSLPPFVSWPRERDHPQPAHPGYRGSPHDHASAQSAAISRGYSGSSHGPSPQRFWQEAPPNHEPPVTSAAEKPRTRTGAGRKRAKVEPVTAEVPRHPSEEEEEAGLALTGMGLGLSAGEMRARRDSGDVGPVNKRIKVENEDPVARDPANGVKKPEQAKKSCAECRRLKAKCDRVFPCSNCRRRGCALVCPDGDLGCMQGKRLVLASTEQLHERIAQLEAALSTAHAQTSSSAHPLLAPEYLDGGFASIPPPANPTSAPTKTDTPPQPAVTMSLSSPANGPQSAGSSKLTHERGASEATSYQLLTPAPDTVDSRSGSSGRMAVKSLLLSEDVADAEGKKEATWASVNAAPALIVGAVGSSLMKDQSDRQMVCERLGQILKILPPMDFTADRADGFWERSQWYQSILRREEFEKFYLPACYSPTPENPLTPHKLACVLMMLVLDTYFDISTADDRSATVALYWDGVQRCFDLRFGWAASVAGVQALGLATFFVGFGFRGALASSFVWLRMMTTAALQLGLHKEPHGSLPEDEREFRRRIFHELYTIDCIMSVNHGQRTGVLMETIEAAFPKHLTGLAMARYEYMRSVKSQVIEVGCMPDANPASDAQVEQIWETVCLFDPSRQPQAHCPLVLGAELPPVSDDLTRLDVVDMTRITNSMCHFKAQLFLYRPSLRRLIGRLRTSAPRQVITLSVGERRTVERTYQACKAIIACSLYMTRTHPRIAARCWAVWVQTFSATVSIAALAIWCFPHVDSSSLQNAFEQLSEACKMIESSDSKRSLGVLDLMPILRTLVITRHPQLDGRDPATATVNTEGENMIFLLLGGHVEGSLKAAAEVAAEVAEDVSSAAAESVPTSSAGRPEPATSSAQPFRPINMGFFAQATPASLTEHKATPLPASMPDIPFALPQSWAEEALSIYHPQAWQVGPTPQESATSTAAASASAAPADASAAQAAMRGLPDQPDGVPAPTPGSQAEGAQFGDSSGLWAKLQTFYEPTTPLWTGGVGWQPTTTA